MTVTKRPQGRPPSARRLRSKQLLWTARAERDLVAIGDFIARDNPAAALRWLEKLFEAAELAVAQPLLGRMVPELGVESIRELVRRHYRLVYRVGDGKVTVLTVFEGHRSFRASNVKPTEDE